MTERTDVVQTALPRVRNDPYYDRPRVQLEAAEDSNIQPTRRPEHESQNYYLGNRDSRVPENSNDNSARDRNHIHYYRDPRRRDRFEEIPPRSGRSRSDNQDYDDAHDERFVVPALPMPVAVICCVLNFILPGFGSMTAAVCLLCCGKTEDMTGKEKCGSCLTVFGIGMLQLLLVACFLIGWIWSCIWGVTFIGMSATFYDEEDEEMDERERRRHHMNGRARDGGRLPPPQVVVDQPYPGLRYEDLRRERRRQRRRREQRSRRTPSRISITRSTLIYPMRAPSNIAYNSPPPPYQEAANGNTSNSRRGITGPRDDHNRNVNNLTIPEDMPNTRNR